MIKLMIIDAFDHFSTDNFEEIECFVRFIGEIIAETEDYITLRHCKADIKNNNSAEETHNIYKPAIIRSKILEVDWEEIK